MTQFVYFILFHFFLIYCFFLLTLNTLTQLYDRDLIGALLNVTETIQSSDNYYTEYA